MPPSLAIAFWLLPAALLAAPGADDAKFIGLTRKSDSLLSVKWKPKNDAETLVLADSLSATFAGLRGLEYLTAEKKLQRDLLLISLRKRKLSCDLKLKKAPTHNDSAWRDSALQFEFHQLEKALGDYADSLSGRKSGEDGVQAEKERNMAFWAAIGKALRFMAEHEQVFEEAQSLLGRLFISPKDVGKAIGSSSGKDTLGMYSDSLFSALRHALDSGKISPAEFQDIVRKFLADPAAVAAEIGNTRSSDTLRIYAHSLTSALEAALRAGAVTDKDLQWIAGAFIHTRNDSGGSIDTASMKLFSAIAEKARHSPDYRAILINTLGEEDLAFIRMLSESMDHLKAAMRSGGSRNLDQKLQEFMRKYGDNSPVETRQKKLLGAMARQAIDGKAVIGILPIMVNTGNPLGDPKGFSIAAGDSLLKRFSENFRAIKLARYGDVDFLRDYLKYKIGDTIPTRLFSSWGEGEKEKYEFIVFPQYAFDSSKVDLYVKLVHCESGLLLASSSQSLPRKDLAIGHLGAASDSLVRRAYSQLQGQRLYDMFLTSMEDPAFNLKEALDSKTVTLPIGETPLKLRLPNARKALKSFQPTTLSFQRIFGDSLTLQNFTRFQQTLFANMESHFRNTPLKVSGEYQRGAAILTITGRASGASREDLILDFIHDQDTLISIVIAAADFAGAEVQELQDQFVSAYILRFLDTYVGWKWKADEDASRKDAFKNALLSLLPAGSPSLVSFALYDRNPKRLYWGIPLLVAESGLWYWFFTEMFSNEGRMLVLSEGQFNARVAKGLMVGTSIGLLHVASIFSHLYMNEIYRVSNGNP